MATTQTNFNQGVFFNPDTTTDVWETPQGFYNSMNELYKMNLDVCAFPNNAKCERYFTPEQDGLKQRWEGRIWMNPPYGREIGKWVRKAYEEVERGNAEIAVCLVPARTCSQWWHDFCMKGEVMFIRHRLRFGGAKTNAPFPNAVVVFRRGVDRKTFATLDRNGSRIS